MGEKRIAYEVLRGSWKGRDHLEDQRVVLE
jgi:hypothetical protein